MSRWRPSPEEERWLAVASDLGAAVPRAVLTERCGGWRSTGPLARIALFVLGVIATGLLLGILRAGNETTLLIAGLIAASAAEWLHLEKRLHASGIEEGLCVSGLLMIGAWVTIVAWPGPRYGDAPGTTLLLIAVAGAAGLRLLNPFVTSCAVLALVYWVDSTQAARAIDARIGGGMTAFSFGCTLAVLALALGAKQYCRPSHDRMLDWLVALLPLAAYSQRAAVAALGLAGGDDTGRLATLATLSGLGALLLIAGVRRRRHAPILGFMGCLACLAVEVRLATSIANETWLILCGLVALAAAIAVDRWLREPRNGLTSGPLTDRQGPLDLLQTAGAALLAQRSTPGSPAPEDSTVGPGEGRFGGGGASGRY